MIERDGFYFLPILPPAMREQLERLPSDKSTWPPEFRNEYKRLRSDFTAAKGEFIEWMRKDRDSRMNKTAKLIGSFIVDRLNFDTGRCDPSHQFIADELNIGLRTVERTIPKIGLSGWFEIKRRGRTTTNFYVLRVGKAKVNALLDATLMLRDRRIEARQYRLKSFTEPTKMAGHSASEPVAVAGHEPAEMAGHEPPLWGGKPLKGTSEGEHLNKISCSESREVTYVPATESESKIPVDEVAFGPWIRQNIPDPTKYREAYQLLRDRKMTPEILRGMAA